MKNLLFFLIALMLLGGCAMKRSNPLDPVENDILVPNEVIGIDVSHSQSDEISITWVSQDDADGYYIYRCMSIDGYYALLADGTINDGQSDSFIDDSIIPGNWYYYKMSAFVEIDGRRLEGWRSGPKTW
ncbi:MAG: hypothetical protein K9N06_10355 [Candidatus Cloacimonetes bacterium]|nr:hypothetical protein [Candidatus Cloacimonadota bacterium]